MAQVPDRRKAPKVVTATDGVAVVPEGFQMASFANLGDADGTLTINGAVFTLLSKTSINLSPPGGNDCWHAVTMDATGTVIQCMYI